MKTKYLSGLVLLLLFAVGFASCNDAGDSRWYDSMKDGKPFFSSHVVRFYFIDEEGHDLINMLALPISCETLPDTPPAPPTEFATTADGLWYNNEINNIVMDKDENLNSFFTYAYGDSRYSDFTFYVYFKGTPYEMTLQHRYQGKRKANGDYISDIVSWKVNGKLVYSADEPTNRRKVFIMCKADGETAITSK